MLRGLLFLAFVVSLILYLAVAALSVESYRRGISFDVHARDGTLWKASAGSGLFIFENQTATRLRTFKALGAEAQSRWERANELRAQWQRRPDRFQKSKDDLVARMIDAELQAIDASERSFDVQLKLNDEQRRRVFVPPVSHSIRSGRLVVAASLAMSCWLLWPLAVHLRRARRRRNHLCIACGYDLRASTGCCPECGAPVPAAPRAASVSG